MKSPSLKKKKKKLRAEKKKIAIKIKLFTSMSIEHTENC